MLFNSVVFLFIFLPLTLLGYYFLPKQFKNAALALASILFFAWGGVNYTLLLLVSTGINYVFGLLAEDDRIRGKLWLILGIIANLGILVYFKYAGFFMANASSIAQYFGFQPLPFSEIILPIGISFYTFHGMSYQIDVYRNQSKAQRNFLNLLLYKTFFPQLIAGPIIRYNTIAEQLKKREFSFDNVNIGLQRFIIGLAKKVIIANTFAYVADALWGIKANDLSTGAAWLAVFCYTFQIYTDFSAYSDMAIGLARMFGFHFPENFEFPYLARNFKDFWTRWHISLSSWFRDYLYIPLGGNRDGLTRTYFNLWVVFLFTGFWHGASWNFIIWGAFHGLFLSFEKWNPFPAFKLPRPMNAIIMFFLVMLSWVPFRAIDLSHTISIYKKLFGFGVKPTDTYYVYMTDAVLTIDFYLITILTCFLSFGGYQYLSNIKIQHAALSRTFASFQLIGFVLLFVLCSIYIISGSYSPFIYFRF